MGEKFADIKTQVLEEIRNVPAEYWPNLLQLVRSFREAVTLTPAEVSLERGWQEALRGGIRDIDDLWSDIDAE